VQVDIFILYVGNIKNTMQAVVSLTSKWTSKTILDGGGEGYITFGVGVRLLGALFCSFITEDATGSSEPSDSSAFEL
jgi:hypothetical protein